MSGENVTCGHCGQTLDVPLAEHFPTCPAAELQAHMPVQVFQSDDVRFEVGVDKHDRTTCTFVFTGRGLRAVSSLLIHAQDALDRYLSEHPEANA